METEDGIPEFGEKRENEERRDGGCGIVFDPATRHFAIGRDAEGGLLRLFSGGVEEGEDIQEGILREVREESGLYDFLSVETIGVAMAHYHNRLKNINRVAKATCLLIILQSTALIPTKRESHETFTLDWASAAELRDNWKQLGRGADHWVYFLDKAVARLHELGYTTTSDLPSLN